MQVVLGQVDHLNAVNNSLFFYSGTDSCSQKTNPPVDAPDNSSEVVFAPEAIGMYLTMFPVAQSIVLR